MTIDPTTPVAERIAMSRARELRPRNVALLNALFFGVGYLFIGQWKKAIVAVLAAAVVGPLTFGIAELVLAELNAIDGLMQARLQRCGASLGDWTFFNMRVK